MPRRAVPVVRTGSSEFGRERFCLAHGNDPPERFQIGMAGRGIRSRVSREARGYWGEKFRWVVNHHSRLARRHKRERRTYDPLRLQLTGIAYERCLDNTAACGTVEAVRAFGFGYGAAGLGNGGGPNNHGNVRTQSMADPGVGGGRRFTGMTL